MYFVLLDSLQSGNITTTEDTGDISSTEETSLQEMRELIIELEQKNNCLEQMHSHLKTNYEMEGIVHKQTVKDLQSKIQTLKKQNRELQIFEMKGDPSDKEVIISFSTNVYQLFITRI